MYRAVATANAFAAAGWRVTVLTATRDTFERITGSDPASEALIDPRINVVRIPFDPARGESDLKKWPRARVFSPLLWNYLRWMRARTGFPEMGYGSWAKPLSKAAEEVHVQNPVSLVVGTANPNVDFVPGYHLHRKFGVPYVMDYRDAWNLDTHHGKRLGHSRDRANALERKLIDNAAEVWFVNPAILQWHADEHPGRARDFHLVMNGYDPEHLDFDREWAPNPAQGLTFGYLGTIYGPMPVRETLEGWSIARRRSSLVARSRLSIRGRLGHFAEPDSAVATLIQEFSGENVLYEGPVSKTQVASVYDSFDVLLLILGHSKFVTSGKVFEYAATGLPIASLHHPETAATEVLRGRKGVFPVLAPSPEHIADAIIAVAEYASRMTSEDLRDAQAWARHLARQEQLRPRIETLRSIVEVLGQ